MTRGGMALFVAIALMSGCARKGGNIALLAVGGGLVVTGTAIAASPDGGEGVGPNMNEVGVITLLLGLPLLFAGVYGLATMRPADPDDDD